MLELKLLGSPQILLNGHPVSGLSAAKSQALLFYLAINDRPQSRLALAGLLWPDKRETDALANLRQALYHLRNVLPDYLEINRLTVAFNATLPCHIDALLFEREISAPDALAVRQMALDRYRGEFLAGFYVEEAEPFDAWAVVLRERLHRLATEALHDLVTDLGARQEITLGVRYVNQWLALEPWHEAAHHHKIQFLAWDGQTQAALAHYERCRQLLAEELGATPSAATEALVAQIRQGELRVQNYALRNDGKPSSSSLIGDTPVAQNLDGPPALEKRNAESVTQHDWGEMPDGRVLWGRDAELQQIEQWLVAEQQRVVTILGMGGMGKTTLAAALTLRVAPQFTWVLWRSLRNAPPLSDIVRDWVQTLSGYTLATWPTLLDAQLALLFAELRRQRCLLILDNVENILSPADEQRGDAYRPAYADYGLFFARLGESAHRSSLLLTSRELPPELARLERRSAPVRRLPLPGLPLVAGQHLLTNAGLIGSVDQQRELLTRYSGNPLALQLVGKTIQDFFAGEIAAFLSDETLLFDDVREMLDQQFARLTGLERELLIWLAIEREPVTLPTLQEALLYAGARSAILDALLDLQQRSLLEKLPTGFTLQNVIMEYATAYLIDGVCHEIETATPHLLHSHALLRAQAKEYVRQSQARLLLQPIGKRLQLKLGTVGMETKLKALLDQIRQGDRARATYIGGNILNLLLHLGMDPTPYDFSQLAVWQADLRKTDLPMLNLAQADLRHTIFAQHFVGCHALVFSPSGHLLAGGMANGEIHLWQTATHQLEMVIKAHETVIWELVFSPDGQLLASGSKDGSIRLWDVQTHQCQQTFIGHTDWVRAVAFHPAGRILASGGHDQTVRLWEVDSGRTLHVLNSHTGWVMGLAFSPDGACLVSTSTDSTVRLWNVNTGQEQVVLRGHSACTESLCFTPDGMILATASYDQTICLWDLSTPIEPNAQPLLHVLRGHKGAIYAAAFSPDGRWLFSAGHEEMIYIWDVATGQRLYILSGHSREVNALAVHPMGAMLATTETGTSTLCLWEIKAKPTLTHIFYGYRNWANDVAFHPYLPQVASASPAEKLYLWDTQTGQHLQTFHCENGMGASLAFGRQTNGKNAQLAFGSIDHSVWLWPIQQQLPAAAEQRPAPLVLRTPGEVHAVAFSADGRQVMAGGYDGAVHLWDAHTGQPLRQFMIDGDRRLKGVSMSADGCFIAAGSHNTTVALWHVATGEYQQLQGHTEWVWAVAFHVSGILASGSFDRTVRLWNVHSREVQQVLSHESSIVQVVAFNRDGSLLAVGTGDAMIYLWDAHTLTTAPTQPLPLVHKWKAHGEVIQGLAFNSEGRLLASASLDGTVKVWDMQTRKCCHTLQAPGPYEGMNISGVTGISEAQKAALQVLGALTEAPVASLAASSTLALAEQKAQETATDQEVAPDALSAPMPHNLPQPATPFVGRANDLAELTTKLANPACRLLTLVGPGGMGKTRLAIQAAQTILDFGSIQDNPKLVLDGSKIQNLSWKDLKFADGIFFVGLAGVGSSDLLAATIAAALDFTFSGSGDPKTQLLAYLRAKSLLLVLDNFEHLLDGVALVSALLTTAPGVKVMASSREPLNLREEWLHFLSGMSYPATGASGQVEAYTAIQLFTQCALQVQPDFDVASEAAAVTRICQLVEGMPLGIELAATWLKFYSCGQIAEEITHDLDFLTTALSNVPARHRSLRAIFEHSWRLLSSSEQYVLQRLAVFRGGFTQAAAEGVVGAERAVLLALVEKSLLQLTPARRFQFHELMRQFAEEKLLTDPQAAAAIKERHALYYLLLLKEQTAQLKGHKQLTMTEILEAEIENVRTAWQWGVANQKVDEIDRALESLHTFYSMNYWFQEGETTFGQAVATLQMDEPVGKQGILIGKLLFRQGVMAVWFAWTAGEADHWAKAARLYQEALAILSRFDAPAETGLALSALAALHFHLGNFEAANPLFVQALQIFTAQDNRVEMGRILHELGMNFVAQGNYQEAIQTLQQASELCEQSGDLRMRGEVLNSLAQVHMAIEEYTVAQQMIQAILSARTAAADQRGMASSLALLGDLAWRMGDYATAQRYSQESLSLLQAIGLHKPKEVALNNLGNIACSLADYRQAAEHFRTVLAINSTTGTLYYDRYVAVALNGLATVLINQGQLTQAAALLSLVIRHAATWQEMRHKATHLLATLAAELPAGALAAIQAHPQPQDLAAFIMPLLTTPQATTPQATTPQATVQKVALNALGTREETGEWRQPGNTTIALASAVSAPRLPPIALPAEVTGFVGREMELVLVQQRLADPACRLLTITGMGGVGKSRLALRTAHLLAARLPHAQAPQFRDGIYYVPLAAVDAHPQLEHLLATTVAAVLGLLLTSETPTSQLLQALAEKDLLLILDNCEHLPVAAFIDQLLQQTRAVKVLVTSRARLHVRGEQLIRLTGLTTPTVTLPAPLTPEEIWQLNDHSAIRLFVQSVQAILPDFTLDPTTAEAVAQICQLLHGLPLGLELAATWAHLLPLPEIVQEIRQNLDFLASAQLDAPRHQQSLRAVFNHSWQRLTKDEQHALRRLTVFSGGFTREAAAQVAGATLPLLAQLTDKSLVQRVDPAGETMTKGATSSSVRYELQPVVRQYAAEQLSLAAETRVYQERHAAYIAQFLAAQRSALQSAQQQAALRAIHAEIENVRAAWQWLLVHLQSAQSDLVQAAEQVSQGFDSLFHFYDMRSWFQEGEAFFGQLAQHLSAVIPAQSVLPADESALALWRLQAKALARQGWFAFHLGRDTESRRLLTTSLQRLQQVGAAADTIFPLTYLGAVLRHLGEFVQAIAYLQEAQQLAEQHNDLMGASIALNTRGQIALVQGDLVTAQRLCQQALTIKRTIGDRWGMIFSLGYLGRAARATGDYAAAQTRFAECLSLARDLEDQRGAAFALQWLGDTAYAAGALAEAQAHYQESLAIYQAIGNRAESSVTLVRLGKTYRACGDTTQARQALRTALALAWSLPAMSGLSAALLGLANLALDAGQDADAIPPLRFVAQHAASSQQQRQQATQLLAALGAAVADESDWDLSTYVQAILAEGQQGASTVTTPPSAVAALPPASPPVAPLPFIAIVARDQEVARLTAALTQMVTGQSQVYFVAGEAGSGKSTLTRLFVQQAQASHPGLVVLGTLCSAQHGGGDPYLPFRALLQQLTGTAAPTSLATPLPAATNAPLLMLVMTALIEQGFDLIENLVDGNALVAVAEAMEKPDQAWLSRLRDAVTQAQKSERRAVAPQRIFAEYTAVLQRVSSHYPVVLLLDDLQWADASSLGLLFHLSRHLEQSRLLLLGTYRPEELTNPTRDELQPLALVVSECKRRFGDVVIDLDRTIERTGRRFVDACLDSEPNRLGERFRQALFAHTKGQPLFTIELLRDLQARGYLQRDATGAWVEPTAIAWTTLPARVEGIIEVRMGRLALPLRQLLQAASVEGEEFTAEVVARVLERSVREVVRQLDQELDRQARLVVALACATSGTPRPSRYRFRHQLFQHYLYQGLSTGERRLFHRDVAAALSALYGNDHAAITVHLARHWAEAGENERAATYAIRAGDNSARAFAFVEARLHYGQALKLLAELDANLALCRLQIDATCKYADAAVSFAPAAAVVAQIKAAEPLLARLPVPLDQEDRARRAWLHRWLGHFARLCNETATAFAYLEPLLAEAQALDNAQLGADVAGILGWMYLFLGRFAQAEPLLQQTLAFCENAGNQREWAQSANDCGVVVAQRGRCAEGIALVQRCLQIAQAAKDAEAIATNHFYLAWVYLIVGEEDQAFAHLRLALTIEAEAGQVGLADVVAMFQGWLHCRRGEIGLAQAALARMQSHDNYLYSVVYPIIQLELALGAGQPAQAATLAQQTIVAATASSDRWSEGCAHRVLAQALATGEAAVWTDVDRHFAASVQAFEAGGATLEVARTHMAWGKTLVHRGAAHLASAHFTQAAAQFTISGLTEELTEVQTLIRDLAVL